MNAPTLRRLCQQLRPELACLGEVGAPLVELLGVVEHAATGRGPELLHEPGFALDVLTSAGPGTDATLVGRVLDFLRARAGGSYTYPPSRTVSYRQVSVAEAVASHDRGPLAVMAVGTARTYRTWTRRLAEAHGDGDVRDITPGDLRDLIARHVVERRRTSERRRPTRSAEDHAVGAYRHLWAYLVQKGCAAENVAMQVSKPARTDPNRRGIRPDEAAGWRWRPAGTRCSTR